MKDNKTIFHFNRCSAEKNHPAVENFVINIFPNFLIIIFSFLFQPPTIYHEMASMAD